MDENSVCTPNCKKVEELPEKTIPFKVCRYILWNLSIASIKTANVQSTYCIYISSGSH